MNMSRSLSFLSRRPLAVIWPAFSVPEGGMDAVGWDTDLTGHPAHSTDPSSAVIVPIRTKPLTARPLWLALWPSAGHQVAAVNLETGTMRIYGKQQIVEELGSGIGGRGRRMDSSPA